MSLNEYFEKRLSNFQIHHSEIAQKARTFTWIRAGIFIVWIYLLYRLSSYSVPAFTLCFIGGAAVFFIIINVHKNIEDKLRKLGGIVGFNRDELRRLKGEFSNPFNGTRYMDQQHPYSNDLDIFGANSLFEEINRCRIPSSQDHLAEWLKNPVGKETVLKRQDAINQLQEQIDWIQEFEAEIGHSGTEKVIQFDNVSKAKGWVVPVSIVLIVIASTMIALWIMEVVPFGMALLTLLINGLFLYSFQRNLMKMETFKNTVESLSNQYLESFFKLKDLKPGKSELLTELKSRLESEGIREMNQLRSIIYLYDSRANMLYWVINLVLLLDMLTFLLINAWFRRNSERLRQWTNTIHQMEVLNSIAMYKFVHPDYVFPQLNEGAITLEAKGLGHPLIDPKKCVRNDFNIQNERSLLITGSNMSGKSTFLRTIGISVVMAWTGLPVNASSFTTSKFEVFCSMRTQDDLAESTSSFYAELKRIKKLFDTIDSGDYPVLYFLDEILKGTNSYDRHSGAKGIIERLLKTKAFGFVSTHDLELSDEFSSNDLVADYSFNSELINEELVFDYKLTEGKCHSKNAAELLRLMGIVSI